MDENVDVVRVRRRTLPWRVRLRGGGRVGLGVAELGGDVGQFAEIPIVGVVFLPIAVALLAIGLVLAAPFLLVLLLEVLAVLLVGVGVLAWRVRRGDPWPVEGRDADGRTVVIWWCHGWRAARAAARRLEEAATVGEPLPPPGTVLE